eukprot:TRINITY_DN19294_c0_g1_i1.p1 TRINITY_DN19294_c0_g1~~TRINITY_DN19294_c0_g1_i1.p1  ORF type:complete len:1020 (+),score=136.57 TRINITY_DN19294_c0_g1_i1:59-3118(+)
MQLATFDPSPLVANASPREKVPAASPQSSPRIEETRAEPTYDANPGYHNGLEVREQTGATSNSANGVSGIKFFKEGESSPIEGSPASRLSGSPSACYPAFRKGAVQAVGASLAPPPMGACSPPAMSVPGGSPYSGFRAMPPPAGAATFSAYGGDTPGGMTTPGGLTTRSTKSYGRLEGAASPGGLRRSQSGISTSTPGGRAGGATPQRFGNNLPAPGCASPSRRKPPQEKKSSTSRMDPEQVPRPVGQHEAVKQEGGKVYETNKYHVPPPATSVCTVVDRGSASCEFIRCTTNQVPSYPSTANTAHVPIAVAVQPFAELTSHEEPVPCVNLGEDGPMRCTRCKAYVSTFFTWHNGGHEATCNFCNQKIEVPADYMCGVDDKGKRADHADRPELNKGTVDYVAPSDYSETLPTAPATIFVIEATHRSLQCGLLPQVLCTLRSLLGFLQAPSSKIGIILFDRALHFFAFYPGLDCARQVTVSDTEDPYAPCGADALLVDSADPRYRSQLDQLFEELPGLLCADGLADHAAGQAALKAATELMGSRGGGHVVMFHSTLPNSGLGALRYRDDLKLFSEPESGGLFIVQQPAFIDDIANDCLARGVSVSVFCAPGLGMYIDMATLTKIPRRTGGEICYYPNFDPNLDGERLHFDLCRAVVQPAAYSAIFKIRVSKGLSVESMHATWDPEVIDPSTFTISRLSVDATVNFTLVHEERIEGQKHIYVQVACLHTDRFGQRRIRVSTLQLPLTSSLSNVFRYAEVDSVTNLLIKRAAASALSGNGSFKDKLSKSTVDMLHAYRVNCASMTSAGQLILPESLKLLPLYIGSVRKMPAFRSGSDIRIDDRMVALLRILGLPVALTAPLVYPRVYTLHPLSEKAGCLTGVEENVYMPPSIASCIDKLVADRIYLIDNGIHLRIYIRPEVTSETIFQIFGVHHMHEVPAVLTQPEDYAEHLSESAERMLACVQQIRRERVRLPWQAFSVVLPGTPEESRVIASLAEDRLGSEMNYVDFLCHIHKLVQNKQD